MVLFSSSRIAIYQSVRVLFKEASDSEMAKQKLGQTDHMKLIITNIKMIELISINALILF